ncbi:MAG: NAD-binding protein [Bacteroidota bacterium]
MKIKSFIIVFSGIRNILFLVGVSILIGVVGFMLIQHLSFIDALYLSVITLSTIGFETVVPLSTMGKIFMVVYILFNITIFTYAITVLSKYLFNGDFNKKLNALFMKEKINELKNHVIVCGGGRNGTQAIEVLKNNGITTVIIDKNKDITSLADFYIHGDSTNDNDLIEANIQNAQSIIVALPNDSENLFTVLSARQLNPTIKIISRASLDTTRNKLKLAGADNVILPEHIGGAYMASLVFTSDIKEFLDILSNSSSAAFKIKEIQIKKEISLLSLNAWESTGANIIGIKKEDQSYVLNPAPDFIINNSHKIIAIGSEQQLLALENKLM